MSVPGAQVAVAQLYVTMCAWGNAYVSSFGRAYKEPHETFWMALGISLHMERTIISTSKKEPSDAIFWVALHTVENFLWQDHPNYSRF